MRPLEKQRVEQIIETIKSLPLETVDYDTLTNHVDQLLQGLGTHIYAPRVETELFRAQRISSRPESLARLGAPQPEYVTDFQRCNAPGRPMFYCGSDRRGVMRELRADAGNTIYLTRWRVARTFGMMLMPPEPAPGQDPMAFQLLADFIRQAFLKPVDQSMSRQYMVSAAFSYLYAIRQSDKGVTAIQYPSVAAPGNGVNLAINPAVAEQSLDFVNTYELIVTEIRNGIIWVRPFSEGRLIHDEQLTPYERGFTWDPVPQGDFEGAL